MFVRYLFLWSLLFLISGCSQDFTQYAERRLAYAKKATGDIQVVAIQDLQKSNYIKGVLLAAEEINKNKNGILNRKLAIKIERESSSFESSKGTIHKIVSDPKTVAVLGHRKSSIALPASVVYEKSNVVFITSFATMQSLTGHNFKYIFRMAPNTEVMGKQLASTASFLGYERVVILYARGDINREEAFLFEDAALKHGIKLVKRSSFPEKDSNYRPIISRFNDEVFDAVFISAPAKAAANMAKQLREMGIDQPIIGTDSLNGRKYALEAGLASNKTIVPSLYSPNQNSYLNNKFNNNYFKKYNSEPDYNAAQGYDSMMILADAIEAAGATLPPLLSSTLHFMPAWVGVTGIHGFDQAGDIEGKKYFLKVWRNNNLVSLPALHTRFLIERFQSEAKTHFSKSGNMTNFSEKFSERMHSDDRKLYFLDLAQEMLGFKKIGIIFENSKSGRKVSGYNLLMSLKKQKKLEVIECSIPLSLLTPKEIKQQLISCYGNLSLAVDALLVPQIPSIDKKLVSQLNESLSFFKIPAISLSSNNETLNSSINIRPYYEDGAHNNVKMGAYNGLLKGLKIHEFADKIRGMPFISVNLSEIQSADLSEEAILMLSPDDFLQTMVEDEGRKGL